MAMERRLSAILAADVVAYSRLMEADEAGTFDRLRTHRKELFEPEMPCRTRSPERLRRPSAAASRW